MGIQSDRSLDGSPLSPGSLRTFTGTGFTPFVHLTDVANAVRRSHPGGVDGVLVGLRHQQGFGFATGPQGIIAILIGLLLPAVQKVREASSPEFRALQSMSKHTGGVHFLFGDGSVRSLSASIPTNADLVSKLQTLARQSSLVGR